ncbi:hypothetical protein [Psychrobacillus sp. NPDC093180]|uniref:hypothetical protein n=1 Tax=Psychrobacillus sp. NPDC093180 TaxID=3364489 RepID=UPI00381BD943
MMSITSKKITNPRFQHIQLLGTVVQITLNDVKVYIIGSEVFHFKYGEQIITVEFNKTDNYFMKVNMHLDNIEFEVTNIRTLTDCLRLVEQLRVSNYWENEQMQLYIFMFLRVLVATITAQKSWGYKLSEFIVFKEEYWIESQKKLSKLMLGVFEATNIPTSGFVVTKRAEYLLMLGLNPKEQYSTSQIRQTCRPLLKLIHPDAPLGNTELFKCINEAQQYLK